jgi:hypothetical protein
MTDGLITLEGSLKPCLPAGCWAEAEIISTVLQLGDAETGQGRAQ